MLLLVLGGYFVLLLIISWITGRKSDNKDFFLAGRNSPWFVVAFGMVGASLSGVTFISIPGVVGGDGQNMDFSYMQIVLGYVIGYAVIANLLMPLYYRLNLTSIYAYLEKRLGVYSYKTGAAFFLLSRTIGASFRLFLVAIVMQKFIMAPLGIPFWVTVAVAIALIWIYTFKGGIKTIVWTDTLQTVCMLLAVILTIGAIGNALDLNFAGIVRKIGTSEYHKTLFFSEGWSDPNNFFKQVLSGALITIVMTGLDQDMMQKNLSCRNIGEAKKNMFVFTCVLILANLLFLCLGAILWIYAGEMQMAIPARTDQLFPSIALQHLSPMIGVVFFLGLTAAAYSSADSALTALTTAFCVDFLNFEKKAVLDPGRNLRKLRWTVHLGFSVLLFIVIIIFNSLQNEAVINGLFVAAGYTYGPLLGLFSFGILTRRKVRDQWSILICILAPILSWLVDKNSDILLGGFTLGFLILALNGLLTFIGLWMVSYREGGN